MNDSLPEEKKRILLVEDSEDNRLLIRLFLKKTPHEIDIAENGAIAVQKATAQKYDLVLMDVNMPVMDGYQATKAIREWEKNQNGTPMRILALTANYDKQYLDKARDAGCDAFLTKPIKKAELLEAVVKYSKKIDS